VNEKFVLRLYDTPLLSFEFVSGALGGFNVANGFVHVGTQKRDNLPFTAGFMEWRSAQ